METNVTNHQSLTKIKTNKAQTYPNLMEEELEFSLFDLEEKQNENGKKKFFIGTKKFGSTEELTMVLIEDLSLKPEQLKNIVSAGIYRENPIAMKRSDFS